MQKSIRGAGTIMQSAMPLYLARPTQPHEKSHYWTFPYGVHLATPFFAFLSLKLHLLYKFDSILSLQQLWRNKWIPHTMQISRQARPQQA